MHVLFNALSKIAGTMAAYSCPLFKAIEAVLVDPSFSTGSAVAADALHTEIHVIVQRMITELTLCHNTRVFIRKCLDRAVQTDTGKIKPTFKEFV